MKIVSTAQMRELDRRTIDDFGVSGEELMERAGSGVAEVVRYLCRVGGHVSPVVHIVAGRGNNGGDAFVAARQLKEDGFDVDVWLAGANADLAGDALRHFSRMKTAGIECREVSTREEWDDAVGYDSGSHVLVDGVLGTGLRGPARGLAEGAIRFINAMSDCCLVVSIDVPSGLNSDTGLAEGVAVHADVTATMGMPKAGLVCASALDHVGNLTVVDIGIPEELTDRIESDIELITPDDLAGLLRRRKRYSHKGDFGHLLMLGGSAGMSGAISLAAGAAVRSGAGLVTAIVPRCIHGLVAQQIPEAMVHAADETAEGALTATCLERFDRPTDAFDAVLLGPGMRATADTRALVRGLLASEGPPLVLDADALNALAGETARLSEAKRAVVLTPHPGEMARLFGGTAATVQKDRLAAARGAAEQTGAVVVLKGAGTLVVERGKPAWINMTGNPGMAKGGMGDVLAGLVAGLVARGLPGALAARMGVYLHGRAGDLAAWRGSQDSITAWDVVNEFSSAFRDIIPR